MISFFGFLERFTSSQERWTISLFLLLKDVVELVGLVWFLAVGSFCY